MRVSLPAESLYSVVQVTGSQKPYNPERTNTTIESQTGPRRDREAKVGADSSSSQDGFGGMKCSEIRE